MLRRAVHLLKCRNVYTLSLTCQIRAWQGADSSFRCPPLLLILFNPVAILSPLTSLLNSSFPRLSLSLCVLYQWGRK